MSIVLRSIARRIGLSSTTRTGLTGSSSSSSELTRMLLCTAAYHHRNHKDWIEAMDPNRIRELREKATRGPIKYLALRRFGLNLPGEPKHETSALDCPAYDCQRFGDKKVVEHVGGPYNIDTDAFKDPFKFGLGSALFAIDHHNKENNSNLEFVSIGMSVMNIKAVYMTVEVKDGDALRWYDVQVGIKWWDASYRMVQKFQLYEE